MDNLVFINEGTSTLYFENMEYVMMNNSNSNTYMDSHIYIQQFLYNSWFVLYKCSLSTQVMRYTPQTYPLKLWDGLSTIETLVG